MKIQNQLIMFPTDSEITFNDYQDIKQKVAHIPVYTRLQMIERREIHRLKK